MIGEFFTMNGIRVQLVDEEKRSSCAGCFFASKYEHITECSYISEGSALLDCGDLDGIYKRIDLEKGVKKKLTLN